GSAGARSRCCAAAAGSPARRAPPLSKAPARAASGPRAWPSSGWGGRHDASAISPLYEHARRTSADAGVAKIRTKVSLVIVHGVRVADAGGANMASLPLAAASAI